MNERLKFRPQGTVIRATAKNETNETYKVNGYKLVSNTGAFAASLNPAETGLNPATTLVTLKPNESATSVSGTFATPQSSGANGQLNYFLVWAAPLKTQPTQKETIFTLVTSDNRDLRVYTSNKEIKDRYLMRLSGGIEEEAKLPLEYMAEYNLSAPGVFASSNDGVRHIRPHEKAIVISDWYHNRHASLTKSDPEISAIFKPEQLPVAVPPGYRMPTADDWHAVFTSDYTMNIWFGNGKDFEESYGGKGYISRAQGMNPTSGVASYGTARDLQFDDKFNSESFVAIRFEKKPNSDESDNTLRSAWLYEFIHIRDIHNIYSSSVTSLYPMMLKVTAIKDQTSTLQEVSKSSYWTNALQSGKAIVRYLPYLITHTFEHQFNTPLDGVFYYSASGEPDFSFVLNNIGPFYEAGTDMTHVFDGWGMIRPFKVR